MTVHSAIASIGGYLPQKIVTNHDLATQMDTSDAWIQSRTGIESRRVATGDENTLTMACHAARDAIEQAGLKPQDIDLIIVATSTPHKLLPSTACLVQQHLKCQGPAFDINAVCSGFLYALQLADSYVCHHGVQNALVIGADTLTQLCDPHDRKTAVLFGDGAGAVILQPTEAAGIVKVNCQAQGELAELLTMQQPLLTSQQHQLMMCGPELFKIAVKTLKQAAVDILTSCDITLDQIDWLVPHQANARIIYAVADALELSHDQVMCTIAHHANTTAASIPLAMHHYYQKGLLKRGQWLLLDAFGAGITWGTALIRF